MKPSPARYAFVLPALLALGLAVEMVILASPDPQRPPAAAPGRTVRKVAIVADPGLDATAKHGIGKLTEALRAKGVTVSEAADAVTTADLVVVAGLSGSRGSAASALTSDGAPLPSGAEALTVRIAIRYQGKPAIVIAGSDGVGLMYAALDLADRV